MGCDWSYVPQHLVASSLFSNIDSRGWLNQFEHFAYDPNGNRTRSHRHAAYETDAANRVTRAGDWSFEYDGEGNRIRKSRTGESWTYDYDHRNRLIRVSRALGDGPPADNLGRPAAAH